MTNNVQCVGENIAYEQDITGDTIQSAAWSVAPAGPTLSGQQDTTTSSIILFQSNVEGVWILSVRLTTSTGQIRIGQMRIEVVTVKI